MVRCPARYVIEDREDSAVVVSCELDAGHAGDHEADTPYDRVWWTEIVL